MDILKISRLNGLTFLLFLLVFEASAETYSKGGPDFLSNAEIVEEHSAYTLYQYSRTEFAMVHDIGFLQDLQFELRATDGLGYEEYYSSNLTDLMLASPTLKTGYRSTRVEHFSRNYRGALHLDQRRQITTDPVSGTRSTELPLLRSTIRRPLYDTDPPTLVHFYSPQFGTRVSWMPSNVGDICIAEKVTIYDASLEEIETLCPGVSLAANELSDRGYLSASLLSEVDGVKLYLAVRRETLVEHPFGYLGYFDPNVLVAIIDVAADEKVIDQRIFDVLAKAVAPPSLSRTAGYVMYVYAKDYYHPKHLTFDQEIGKVLTNDIAVDRIWNISLNNAGSFSLSDQQKNSVLSQARSHSGRLESERKLNDFIEQQRSMRVRQVD